MDTAFETETKRIVKAWNIGRDTSYILPENDVFMANKDEIVNYDSKIKELKIEFIECRFRKGHERHLKNGRISPVVPHFFIPNKEKLGIETIPESPEHKKIKSFMYDYFFNNENLDLTYSKYIRKNETIYNKVKLKDLNIDWQNFTLKKEDFFEVSFTDTFNTRRVDLFLKFKSRDSQFGEGLVIEVQLCPQTEEKTKERTIDRALKGYSTIWINKKHFEDHKADVLELKEEIKINSWQSVLHNNADNIEESIYNGIKKYSREFDEKVVLTLETFKNLIISEGMLCPICNKGQLLKRNSKFGFFLGCSFYPNCNGSYKIIKKEDKEE